MDVEINAETRVVGLFGYPLTHSLSPQMHNTAFKAQGLNYIYLPFPVPPENLKEAVKAVKALGLRGVNITIPYKEAVLPFLEELSPEASLTGAVNTIVREEKKLVGYNTDGEGFLRALREAGFSPAGKSVLILGAGGAARAVAFSLALAGVKELYLANRTLKRAAQLAATLGEKTRCPALSFSLDDPSLAELVPKVELIVHASPVGMYPEENVPPLVPPPFFTSRPLVFDLVYNPLETSLLRLASRQGCKVVSGLEMLVHQGAIAFKLWTGREPPVDLMRTALKRSLERGEKNCFVTSPAGNPTVFI